MKISHPSTQQLQAFGLGKLGSGESLLIERHVATCKDCCRVLNNLPDDALLAKLKQGDSLGIVDSGAAALIVGSTALGSIPQALLEHSRYRIVKLLGRGGMGVVYKAEHRLMERLVALKVISRRLIANPLAVERFRREFKVAARLTHPNIVVAHDADEAGGLHFLVMEFVDGVSLAKHVERQGPLPVAAASHFIRQAALGLQHAARQGMVHRDIKPQNLMLTRKGQIKILDFGLARFASEGTASSGVPSSDNIFEFDSDTGLTTVGMIVGTPDYMAPEQAVDSSTADSRSDIYSLGCTFFFLLTGHAPFSEDSVTGTLRSHAVRQPPALQELRADLPAELRRLIEQMMAKDPAKRVQTPGEVARRLTVFATGGLAAAGAIELAESTFDSSTPTSVAGEGSIGIAGPASTMQLVLRGRWQTIWHRARHAMRSSLQAHPRRIAAALAAMLLTLIATVMLIAARNRLSEAEASGSPVAVVKPVKQRPPRVALVLSRVNFWGPDYLAVRTALERCGTAVTVVSSRIGPVTSDAKLELSQRSQELQAEAAFGDIRPGDFDAVVFVPSSNSEFLHEPDVAPAAALATQRTTLRVLTELSKFKVCLAAIGNAVFVLARYRVLDGHAATGPEWTVARSEFGTVKWDASQPVVTSGPDGQFVTAFNIQSATSFVEHIHASARKRAAGD